MISRRILAAIAAASGVSAMLATVASGWLYTNSETPEFNCVECRTFHQYGWPSPWRTDFPPQILHAYHGPFTYGPSGISEWDILLDCIAWFLIFGAAFSMLALAIHLGSSLLRLTTAKLSARGR